MSAGGARHRDRIGDPGGPSSHIDSAIDVVRPTAEVKAIRLQPVLDPSAGMVTGDPGRLQQVVWNLLSNAVKFTPKGGRVEIVLERVNSHVEIAVIDNGRGISREFLPHIFERFQQAESGTTRMHGGLGLGLAIVRHIVDLHGGTPCRSGTTTSWNQRGSPERAR